MNLGHRNSGTDYDVEEEESKPKTSTQAQNEAFFKTLCEESGGDVFSLDEAQDLTSQFYSKKVKPAAVYRGTLDLGDSEKFPDASLAIPVHMYGRTMQAKIPTAKKFSVLSESAAEDNLTGGRTGMVNASRTYKLKVAGDMAAQDMEEDTEVPEDALEKAFMYGKTIVPIRAVDMEALKLSTVKSLTILGFFASSTVSQTVKMLVVIWDGILFEDFTDDYFTFALVTTSSRESGSCRMSTLYLRLQATLGQK